MLNHQEKTYGYNFENIFIWKPKKYLTHYFAKLCRKIFIIFSTGKEAKLFSNMYVFFGNSSAVFHDKFTHLKFIFSLD